MLHSLALAAVDADIGKAVDQGMDGPMAMLKSIVCGRPCIRAPILALSAGLVILDQNAGPSCLPWWCFAGGCFDSRGGQAECSLP
jgi:hypothetical protein